MATKHLRRIGMTMAMLAGVGLVALDPSAASACSLVGPSIEITGQPVAGGMLHVHGQDFFDLVGQLDSMCQGDHTFVAQAPVTVIVAFTTLSGPRSQAVQAKVSGDPVPPATWVEPAFTIDIDVAIPPDATAVHVKAAYLETDATIAGATATTVASAPPTSDPTATPAAPVAADPSFTG